MIPDQKNRLLPTALFLGLASLTALFANEGEREANTVILTEAGERNLRLKTIEVEERTFESTVFAVGTVREIPGKQHAVSSRIPGRAIRVDAFQGDFVTEGQTLAVVESRQPGNPPPRIELKAPRSGLVIKSHILPGDPVQPDQDLFDISDRSEMWVAATIPEQLAAGIGPGTEARLTFPALPGAPRSAKLLRFGVEADREAGAIEGIFQIPNPDRTLLPGMRAEFQIITSRREGVFAVPEEALQGDPANRVVYVKDFELDHAYVRCPVVVGKKSGGWVEIIQGVFPGDEVVTRGAYSLGFVGTGNGPSLKEALDAAHGHEHADDGSELSESGEDEQDHHDHHDEEQGAPGWLVYYAGGTSLLSLGLLQVIWNQRRRAASSSAP